MLQRHARREAKRRCPFGSVVFANIVCACLMCVCGANAKTLAPKRPNIVLDGLWQFRTDPNDIGERSHWFAKPPRDVIRISVPGSWDAQGIGESTEKVRHNYVGKAWYWRTVIVPNAWRGMRVSLHIGGAHRSAKVWFNSAYLGEHFGYVTPFKFDVTDHVRFGGKNLIAICVDSEHHWERDCLYGTFDIPDYMHIDWGGLYRNVHLEATPSTWIEDAFAMPAVNAGHTVARIKIRSHELFNGRIRITAEVHPFAHVGRTYRASRTVHMHGDTLTTSLTIPMHDARTWSPTHPFLYWLCITMRTDSGVSDSLCVRFGYRTLTISGNAILLNGKPIFLHGYGDDWCYPLRLVPPPDVEFFKQRLRVAKAFGFNYVRHHSCTPLAEYFDACDEIGMLVQPELPIVYRWAFDRAKTDTARELFVRQWVEIIKHLRNHPSVAFWCMGNELWNSFPLAKRLYRLAKQLDPTRPVVDSDGISDACRRNANWDRETLDVFHAQFNEHALAWGNERNKHAFAVAPRKPVIIHEMGNFATFPDLTEAQKYTGAIKPFWLWNARAIAERKGMTLLLKNFVECSNKLAELARKLDIESARLQRHIRGYALWLLQDYWTGSMGLVTQFFKPKMSPQWFRNFNADAVVLLDRDECVFTEGQRVRLGTVVVSNYSETPIENAVVEWRIEMAPNEAHDVGGMSASPFHRILMRRVCGHASIRKCIARGRWCNVRVGMGAVKGIGDIIVQLPSIGEPCTWILKVTVRDRNHHLKNEWRLWTFPKVVRAFDKPLQVALHAPQWLLDAMGVRRGQSAHATEALRILQHPTTELIDALVRGERVWLLDANLLFVTLPNRFKPAWWVGSPLHDSNLGIYIPPSEALREFPHESWADLHFYHLVEGTNVVVLDDVPLKPKAMRLHCVLIYGIDLPSQMRLKAHAFEVRVGKGKLLVTTFRLNKRMVRSRPEVKWMLRCLLRYAVSEHFNPQVELDAMWLRERINKFALPPQSQWLNGFKRIVKVVNEVGGKPIEYFSHRSDHSVGWYARQLDGTQFVEWETAPTPRHLPRTIAFLWTGGLGWVREPRGKFTLSLNGRACVYFDVTLRSTVWRGKDGARLIYQCKRVRGQDGFGIFALVVPRRLLKPNASVQLRVTGSASHSRRWFMLYAYDDTVERLRGE